MGQYGKKCVYGYKNRLHFRNSLLLYALKCVNFLFKFIHAFWCIFRDCGRTSTNQKSSFFGKFERYLNSLPLTLETVQSKVKKVLKFQDGPSQICTAGPSGLILKTPIHLISGRKCKTNDRHQFEIKRKVELYSHSIPNYSSQIAVVTCTTFSAPIQQFPLTPFFILARRQASKRLKSILILRRRINPVDQFVQKKQNTVRL